MPATMEIQSNLLKWTAQYPLIHVLYFTLCVESEREKLIHHKANNQCYKQNKLMWQAAREEIPI